MSEPLVDELLELDGVEDVHIEKVVNVTHKKEATGERDEHFNHVRKRIVSEDEFRSIADDLGWEYHGTIDVIGDYHLKDRFAQRGAFDADNEEENQ